MVISIDLDNLMISPHPEYEDINITSRVSRKYTKRNSDPTHTRTLVRMVFCLKSYMKIFHLRFVLFCFPCSSPPVSSSSNLFIFSETQVWFHTDTAIRSRSERFYFFFKVVFYGGDLKNANRYLQQQPSALTPDKLAKRSTAKMFQTLVQKVFLL